MLWRSSATLRFLSLRFFLQLGILLGIPFPVIVMVAVYIIAHVVLTRTKLGRYAYAIGGNEEATLLSGVNVKIYKTAVYGLCGKPRIIIPGSPPTAKEHSPRLGKLKQIAIDEISIGHGHRYLTVVLNLETGAVVADLHQGIKQVFDPLGILNPGKAI